MTRKEFKKYKSIIEKSGMFSWKYYLKTYHDARMAKETPLEHFVKYGLKEDRKPNANFDPAWYREYYVDIKEDGAYPFIHYILFGHKEGRLPNGESTQTVIEPEHRNIDSRKLKPVSMIIAEYPNFFSEELCLYHLNLSLTSNAIEDAYVKYYEENHVYPQISLYFDPNYYLSNNSEIKKEDIEPLAHFVEYGFFERNNPHPMIDLLYIQQLNPDALVNVHSFIDYIYKNQTLSPYFDSNFYNKTYPDIQEAGMLAFDHFVLSGGEEKRLPNSFFDYGIYGVNRNLQDLSGLDLFMDFIHYGDSHRVDFSDKFDYSYYYTQIKDSWDGHTPLFKHYIMYETGTKIQPKKGIDFNEINAFSSEELYANMKKNIVEKTERNIALPESKNLDLITVNTNIEKFIQDLHFVKSDEPEVSIVIPVFNAAKELAECLASIKQYTQENYEIIIADDNSTDDTISKALMGHDSIRYIKNEKNLGFLLNVNNAISHAKGKYVLLLNSDVQFLNDIVSIFKEELLSDKKVGIVGPKILFPSGMLQEAGCTIHQNATTEMVGLGQNENLNEYNIKRYVDYVSGACWLFEKSLFDELGGFDESFAPAYAEDLDFCARVVREGKKVLYAPEARIMHHLSISSNELSSSFKYYQSAVNKKKFMQKHGTFYQKHSKIKSIAFYLPQFHEIKQNDYWWGKNYTEWTAAANAKPQFKKHYQPHVPADLGFYNLTDPRSFENQATLAKRYGLHGFCFYYYNFGDFELMEQALETFMKSKADINFCLCWANENWTKTWDGLEKNILLEQKGNDPDFFLKVLQSMERFVEDSRYIRVDGRPMILIYRESLFDDIDIKLQLWRDYWREKHGEELYICAVDSMDRAGGNGRDPEVLGFDAAVEFPAHHIETRSKLTEDEELDPENKFEGLLLDYPDVVEEICSRPYPEYKRIPGCFPAWDNTPRRGNTSVVMRYAHPSAFQHFLEEKAKEALLLSGDERMIFINAWNEWGEGTHLEPDLAYGHTYLSLLEKMVKEY